MQTTNSLKALLAAIATAVLLAGCASTPAPVVNHSFGLGQSAPAPASSTQPTASSNGVQTFGLGGHANGTVGQAGYTVAPGDTLYSIAFAHGIDFRALAAQNDIPPPYTIHPGQVLKLKASQPAQATHMAIAQTTTAAPSVKTPAVASTAPAQPSTPVFGPVTAQTMTAAGVAPAESASSTIAAAAPGASTNLPPAPVATVEAPSAQPAPATVPTPPPAGATRSVAGIAWRWPASGKVIGGDGAGLDIAGEQGDPVLAAASGTVVYSGNGLIGYGELVIIKHNDAFLSAYGHNSKRLVKEGQHVDAGQEIALMGASGAPRVELHFEIRKNGKPVDPLGYLPQR